jgi:hypothetical protein
MTVSESIQKEFDQWKRDNEQVDDVLVVGIEFKLHLHNLPETYRKLP